MSPTIPESIRVLMPDGTVAETKLETFLAGVVYAEMGEAAPLDALKAQAIASRNYAAAAHRHPELNADVCTTAHCQEWKPVDPVVAPEVFRAVSETWGMVATHGGKLIDAFFFEHCDGHTRNAEDLLPAPVPYLKSTECGCGFVARKGHGVGLCQRGAIVMAYRGASFEEILRHYYRDVIVIPMGEDEKAAPPVHVPGIEAEQPHEPALPGLENLAPEPAAQVELPVPPPTPIIVSPAQIRLPEPQLDFIEEEIPQVEAPPPAREVKTEPPPEQAPVVEPIVPEPPAPTTPAVQRAALEPPSPPPPAPAVVPRTEPAAAPPPPAPQVERPVPAYVEQLNIAASLSAQQIIESTAAAAAEPIVEVPAQPPIHPSELPALDEVIPRPPQRMHVDHLPGTRMIAGCLDGVGIVVTVEDVHGHKELIFSGSAPHYGVGGFETIVGEDGRYLVTIYDEQIVVDVTGDTAFIHIV